MLPKDRLVERGLALDALMARRLGGSGGVARIALETMRNALPRAARHVRKPARAASATRSRSWCTCRCSTSPASARADAARGTARAHPNACGRAPRRSGAERRQHRAGAQLQPYANLQTPSPENRRREAGYILRRRLEGCRPPGQTARRRTRLITEIAFDSTSATWRTSSRVFPRAPGAAAERPPARAGLKPAPPATNGSSFSPHGLARPTRTRLPPRRRQHAHPTTARCALTQRQLPGRPSATACWCIRPAAWWGDSWTSRSTARRASHAITSPGATPSTAATASALPGS